MCERTPRGEGLSPWTRAKVGISREMGTFCSKSPALEGLKDQKVPNPRFGYKGLIFVQLFAGEPSPRDVGPSPRTHANVAIC
jgi:hypothetical protein